jgi:hypothetical protein
MPDASTRSRASRWRRAVREHPTKFLESTRLLLGRGFQAIDVTAVGVFAFAASLAVLRAEQVAEDGGQPGWNECGVWRAKAFPAQFTRVDVAAE